MIANDRLLAICLSIALAISLASPVGAFEIFGMKFFESADSEVEVIDPLNYAVTLQVEPAPDDEDGALEETLNDASGLVSDEAKPVSGSLGLISKAKTDRKRLVAALFEQARYDGLVDIFIEGRDITTLPPDASFSARPVPVTIKVRPGPKYRLGRIAVSTGGIPVDPTEYGLEQGGDAGSAKVLEAEGKMFNKLREDGRPFVAVTHRDIVADAADDRLDYEASLDPGPRVPFGDVWIDGAEDVDPGFIAYMTGIKAGEVFSPKELAEARARLNKLGVFSSVTVKEGKAQDLDGTLPVQVEVGERKFGYYGVGATYSNTEGAGANGYVGYRNLFGRAESLRFDASVSRIGATAVSGEARETSGIDYSSSLVFKKPGVLGPDSVYIGSLEIKREQPLAYDRTSYAATSGVEYDIDEQQKLNVTLRAEYEEITDFLGDRDYFITSVPITYTYDGRDNELNPTDGFYFQALAEPSYGFNTSTAFLKTRLDGRAYLSLLESDRLIFASRLGYGTIFGADLLDIPNDRRFYAGGGGSVRGYEFQSIGPYFPGSVPPGSGFNSDFVDTPTGGLSLFDGSVEARIGITENIQIVPFLDFGTVSDELVPDFSTFKLGAGVGARYLTSFGPIRVDVGIPLDPGPRDASYQIYAGIGQAF